MDSKKSKRGFNGCTLILILLSSYLLVPFYISNLVAINRMVYYGIIVVPIGVHMVKNMRHTIVSKADFFLTLSIACFVILIIFMSCFHETGDVSCFSDEVLPAILKTLSKCSLVVIWYYFYKREKTSITFIELIVSGVCFYILGTFFFLLTPRAKDFWIEIIIQNENAIKFSRYLTYATRFGFGGYSGFEVSFYVCACFPLVVLLVKNNFISYKKGLIYFILLFAGSVFYARVGTIAAIAMSVMCLEFYLSSSGRKIFVHLFLIGMIAMIGIFVVIQNSTNDSYAINWIFEPIINFFSGNSFRTASSDSLSNMYSKFKPVLSTFLIGDGRWKDNGSFYMGVDVWMMRTIYFGGVVFAISYYAMGINTIGAMITKLYENHYRGIKTFLFSWLIMLMLYEIKGGAIIYGLILCIPILSSIKLMS